MAEYSTNTFEMTFYLSNFFGARTVVQEDENGEPEVGLFIPIDRNALVQTDNGGWLTWGFVQEQDIPICGFSHRVIHKTNPANVRALKEKGLEPPLIARMKPTKFYHRKRNYGYQRVQIDGDEL